MYIHVHYYKELKLISQHINTNIYSGKTIAYLFYLGNEWTEIFPS